MLTCKRIQDSVSETVYFLLINVHEDKRDLEHGSSFDVEVTDGQSAWMKKGRPFCEQCMVPSTLSKTDAKLLVGIQRPHTQIADWMATAIQALSQESDTFTYIVTKTKSTGLLRVSSHVDESRALIKQENFPAPQVRWEYFRSMQDFEGNLAGQIDLDHQDDAAANVQHLLHTALDNLSSLQVQVTLELRQHRNYAWHSTCGWPAAQTSQSQLQQHCISFQQEASIAQQQVQRYVEQKEQREAELYVKVERVLRHFCSWSGKVLHWQLTIWCCMQFAAILNEKKAKTLEWKAKAEQAQDTAQRATNKVQCSCLILPYALYPMHSY